MLNFDIMYILISKYYIMLVWFHQRMKKLKQSINLFFTISKRQLWVTLYEQRRMTWDSDRKEFRWLNGRSVPYPNHLKENMPKICPNSWVVDQVREKYSVIDRYLHAKEDVLNVGIGCSNSVIIFLIYM